MYRVTKIYNNGYRCCCHQLLGLDERLYDSREEALAQVPLKYWSSTETAFDYELESIVVHRIVKDADDEIIAEGHLTWWQDETGRGSQYRNFLWEGHIEGIPFKDLHGTEQE